LENWQSEFLQLLTFVVLTASFIHRGTHESRDSDDEMKAILQRLEARIARLDRSADLDRARTPVKSSAGVDG
jgi:hypothetical protein